MITLIINCPHVTLLFFYESSIICTRSLQDMIRLPEIITTELSGGMVAIKRKNN